MLSVVIPIFNESQNPMLERMLRVFKSLKRTQIIFVDSGSDDGTRELINDSKLENFKIIDCDTNSRAKRLNLGIKEASGSMIVLHHPRSVLEKDAFNYLLQNPGLYWGAFTHQFDYNHPLLQFTSWYSNNVRGKKTKIFYLDHCLFARKDLLLKVGLIPEVDIFEDTDICLKLSKLYEPVLLPFISETSSVRFEKNGVWFQAGMNQVLKAAYHLGASHKLMNKIYEKGLELNSKYKKD